MQEDTDRDLDSSQLFLVRLWAGVTPQADQADGSGSGESAVQGRVMHVLSGNGSNFSDWSSLLGLLATMMANPRNDDLAGEEGATP